MNICFRVDGSSKIGSGHVMRCLTLAKELKKIGHMVYFICRLHDGHLCSLITDKGFQVFKLNQPALNYNSFNFSMQASWLGVTPEQDVKETINIIKSNQIQFDWIVIDHYAIDKTWEKEIRKYIPRIMVIDDMADRKHNCDILLDQNYYLSANNRYTNLVPPTCTLLLGPKYALIRDEFINLCKLPKKQHAGEKSILIFYGGSDPANETSKTINAIKKIRLPALTANIVVGPSNPNKDMIKRQCNQDNYIFHFNVDYMAKLMYEADFAICAGGSTTWERYCLGIPAIITAISHNQIELCENVNRLGVDRYLGVSETVSEKKMIDKIKFFLNRSDLTKVSERAKRLVDGNGKKRILNILSSFN